MDKIDKDTFLTDTGLKNTLQRAMTARFSNKNIGTKLDTKIETEEEIISKQTRETIYDKIQFRPPNDNYYEKFPIRPGVSFIKKIFSDEKASQKIETLRINIPETYWNDSSELYYIFNDHRNNDVLTIKKFKNKLDVFQNFKDIEENQYRRELEDIDPFFILRSKFSDFQNNVKVERYETSAENLDKDTGDGLLQRFIRSKGRNRKLDKLPPKETVKQEETRTSKLEQLQLIKTESKVNINNDFIDIKSNKSHTKPTVLRLFYKTKYNPSKKLNVGYCLISKTFIEDFIYYGEKKKILEKYTKICTLNTDNYSSYEVYIMSGEAIKPYEFYAYEIINFLEKNFKLILNSIVIDFIKDERGIIYFLGVKAFTPVKEDPVPVFDYNKYIKDDKNLTKIYKTHTCRLCMLNYPQSKITKSVTFKLLINLKENLLKKKSTLFEHINEKTASKSGLGCKLCELCYKLLITEQELEEIQKTMAISSNIKIASEDDILSIKKDNVKTSVKINNLNQYRVLFYFLRLFDIDWSVLPFSEEYNYKLCIKFLDQKVCIPIFDDMKKFTSETEIDLNSLKIFYFFTNEINTLKHIFKNEIIDFRIIINDDWNTALVECQTTCLSFFDPAIGTIRVKTILNFFSKKNEIKPFKCQLYIGYTEDKEIYSDKLNMFKYKNTNIFMTETDYYSYHSLPKEWNELFLTERFEITSGELEEDEKLKIAEVVDNIIKDLNLKEINEEVPEIYDPYEELVQVHNKNKIINKIKSVPIISDKNTIEKRGKSRPVTSTLQNKFRINSANRTELPKIVNHDRKSDKFIERLLDDSFAKI